jgi:uncharacterized protein
MSDKNAKFPDSVQSYLIRYFNNGGFKREFTSWLWVFRFYWVAIIFTFLILISLVIYLKPISFEKIYLANGQYGTTSNIMANEFEKILSRQGLSLELITTVGLDEGFFLLEDDKSKVNASLYPGGLDTYKKFPDIVSLGAIEIAPIWLFYRGPKIDLDDPFTYFSKKKISIGLKGTANNKIFHLLADNLKNDPSTSKNILELSYSEAESKLKAGQIDAMFFMQDYESPITQRLLNDPNLNIYSFNLADAYIKKFPFLTKVTIPRAAIDISKLHPKQEITLLANTINLLVEKDMHVSSQWGLLMAAKEINANENNFFAKDGNLPKYLDHSFPLSSVAQIYYQNGIPSIFSYLSIRSATLLYQLWVPLLTIFITFSIFIGKFVKIREFISEKIIQHSYEQLHLFKNEIETCDSVPELNFILGKIDMLKRNIKLIWFGSHLAESYLNLDLSIDNIKESGKQKIDHLSKINWSET